MFDCLSVPERKNVQATIEAFEHAFDEHSNVQLLIKVLNLDTHNALSIPKEKAEGNSAIKLITNYMARDDIYQFLDQSDCFVSLHRSEGFGLAIAEAMLLSQPVITTNWSGNTDFCNSKNTFLVDYELIKLKKTMDPTDRVKHGRALHKNMLRS